MKKIGVAIKAMVSGNSPSVIINRGEWGKRVGDIRYLIRHVPAMETDHKRNATIFFFDQQGCYIVVARTLLNRNFDNVAGWIYIPSNLNISGEEISTIITKVKKLVSTSELPSYKTLEELFAQEYEERKFMEQKSSPRNGVVAKRNLSSYSLEEILGENRYQEYYTDYEVIFIETQQGEVTDAVDLSRKPIEKVNHSEAVPPAPTPSHNNMESKAETLKEVKIKPHTIVPPAVSANPIKVTYPEAVKEPASKITNVTSNKVKSNAKRENKDKAKNNPLYIVFGIIIISLAGFFGYFYGRYLTDYNDSMNSGSQLANANSNNYDSQLGEVDAIEVGSVSDVDDSRKAAAYLESNTKWNRAEMEQFSALQGLYDDLASYRVDNLDTRYSEVYEKSSRLRAVKQHYDVGIKYHKPENGANTGVNAEEITYQVYILNLDPGRSNVKEKTAKRASKKTGALKNETNPDGNTRKATENSNYVCTPSPTGSKPNNPNPVSPPSEKRDRGKGRIEI